MSFPRALVFAAALLGAALAGAIAPSDAAVATDGSGSDAPSTPQLAQAGQQATPLPSSQSAQPSAPQPTPQSTHRLTAAQRSEIKSAVDNVAPGTVKQAAVDIVTGVEQVIYIVAAKGTTQQRDELAAAVHRVFRIWRKEHRDSADRRDLEALVVKLAEVGVPVDDAIMPAVQQAEERATARSASRSVTVLSDEQRARIAAALENVSPEEAKQAALSIATLIEQTVDAVATGETIYGVPTAESQQQQQQQKERLAAAIHRTFKVWEKDHAAKADRHDLGALLLKLAALGVPVDTVIIPAVQQEVAAIKSPSPPSVAVSDDQRARIEAEVQKLAPGDLKNAAENVVAGIDRAIQIEASTATTAQQKEQLELRLHRTFREWKTIHETTDRDGLVQLLIKLASIGVSVDDVIIPAVQHAREQAQIRSEVQKLSPQDLKTAAQNVIIVVDRTFTIKLSSATTPQQKAQLEAQVRRTIKDWQAKHADKPDRGDLARLLIKLASIGVSVDDVIIPAVQHAREVAMTKSNTPPPAASGNHPVEPVIIEHHR